MSPRQPAISEDVYFHHMVGTGGNTFAMALSQSTPKIPLVQITRGIKGVNVGDPAVIRERQPLAHNLVGRQRRLFFGHNLYGLVELAGLESSYFTILRNPFDRLITDFFWSLQFKSTSNSLNALDEFKSFVQQSHHLNFYIHHLGSLDYRNSQHFSLDECSLIDNARAYEMAKNALNNRFWFCGIAEKFNESLFHISHQLQIRSVHPWWLSRHPKTKFRPDYFDLSLALRTELESKQMLDWQLYEDARNNFENSWQTLINGESKRERALHTAFLDYHAKAHPLR